MENIVFNLQPQITFTNKKMAMERRFDPKHCNKIIKKKDCRYKLQ